MNTGTVELADVTPMEIALVVKGTGHPPPLVKSPPDCAFHAHIVPPPEGS